MIADGLPNAFNAEKYVMPLGLKYLASIRNVLIGSPQIREDVSFLSNDKQSVLYFYFGNLLDMAIAHRPKKPLNLYIILSNGASNDLSKFSQV